MKQQIRDMKMPLRAKW